MLFSAPAPASNPLLLTDKYRPRTVAAFRGLLDTRGRGPKAICAKIIANPYPSAWMFVGASGLGKTTLALALAGELSAEVHHIPSHGCDAAAIKRLSDECQHYPAPGKLRHVIIIDEADAMTRAAQLLLLSHLDGTNPLPDTIWIFTANDTEGLHDRFLSRTTIVPFSKEGMAKHAADLLAEVWRSEAGDAPAPNFAAIVKASNNNVRAALMALQSELMYA